MCPLELLIEHAYSTYVANFCNKNLIIHYLNVRKSAYRCFNLLPLCAAKKGVVCNSGGDDACIEIHWLIKLIATVEFVVCCLIT